MKIISGQLKGRNFYMPAGIRPTQNMLRKAVFDILGHDLKGLSFLDLFAGSGAVGLEAVSLGAQEVFWVEKDPRHAQVIQDNLRLLGVVEMGTVAEVLAADSFFMIKEFSRRGKKFNVVFLDPPFHLELGKKALKLLGAYDILHPHCFVISQTDKRDRLEDLGDRFKLFDVRKYGNSVLTIFEGIAV